jgi:CheY-like chemotaxis protein/HPt (histidine-containing phosphotransfer) domain-containing protein
LFGPFEQMTVLSRRFGGTGLGRAISTRLAEALGGTLTVRSAAGKGSTFVLTLETGPLDGVAFVSPSINDGFVPSKRTKQKLPRLRGRILLAEDAPDNQRLIAFYLRKAGAEVAVAENGKQACDLVTASAVEGKGFDLVLMDMQMPELDGYGATAWLRRMGHRMPVIALTAHSMEGDREKCLAAGCSDFVTKPIDRKAVLRLLRTYLDQEHRVGAGRGEGAPAGAPRDDDELAELRERFVSRLHERARLLEAHLERGDLHALATEAHQLKGTAGAYGFPAITQAAAELVTSLGADGTLDGASPLVHRLVALCDRAHPSRLGTVP